MWKIDLCGKRHFSKNLLLIVEKSECPSHRLIDLMNPLIAMNQLFEGVDAMRLLKDKNDDCS